MSTQIRVMTYNIGHYNMGLATHGYPEDKFDEKSTNLKEMYMEYAPDFIGIQEEEQYADNAKTKKASPFLYSPVWTFRSGYNCTTIRAKYKVVSNTYELSHYSNGMTYRHGLFKIGDKRLLFISTHAVSKVGNNAARLIQYKELFEYINNTEWDWCIVTGDFNTTDEADKKNLKKLCEDNNFTMAIGQYLPWVDTYLGRAKESTHHSFDNILVSPGCTIKSTKVLRSWWSKLYSDHVPVVADIVLL